VTGHPGCSALSTSSVPSINISRCSKKCALGQVSSPDTSRRNWYSSVAVFSSCVKNLMLKHLTSMSSIFPTYSGNTTSPKAVQLCTQWTWWNVLWHITMGRLKM
jgi:hypothetical protein